MSINGDSANRTESRPAIDHRQSHQTISKARKRLDGAEARHVAKKSESPFLRRSSSARRSTSLTHSPRSPEIANRPLPPPINPNPKVSRSISSADAPQKSPPQSSVTNQATDARTAAKPASKGVPNGPSARDATHKESRASSLETSSHTQNLKASSQVRKKRRAEPATQPVADTLPLESGDAASHSHPTRPADVSVGPTQYRRGLHHSPGWKPLNWPKPPLPQNRPPATLDANLTGSETDGSPDIPDKSRTPQASSFSPEAAICESLLPDPQVPNLHAGTIADQTTQIVGNREFTAMGNSASTATVEPSAESFKAEPILQTDPHEGDQMTDTSASASNSRQPSDDLMSNGVAQRSNDSPNTSASSDNATTSSSWKSRLEAKRNARLLKFDSATFDNYIYSQSQLKPPEGVSISGRLPVNKKPSTGSLVAVAANPAIHGMHYRSDEWYRQKAKEIQRRGGRKAWFGKTAARMRWLRDQETIREKEFKASQGTGTGLRRDPQPRTYKRPLDFSDVPEEDLPDEVKQNPAWLRACAWMRAEREKSLQQQIKEDRFARERSLHRQRELERSTRETEQFFASFMSQARR